MKARYSDKFLKAAEAAGVSPEKLAKSIQGLLSLSKCRNTSPIFSTRIMEAISRT